MKTTYDVLKDILEEFPFMYHNNACSILLAKVELDAPGYYLVTLSNLDQVDEDFSGSVDIHYSMGSRGDDKVLEVFFGDDPYKDSHFNKVGYLAMTPYGLLDGIHDITDRHFAD